MADLHPLLELQRIDSAADALRKERDALPERAALVEAEATLVRLAAEREATRAQRVALAGEERRLEAEVGALREQAREVEGTLYSGTVRVIAELEGLQARLTSLRAQQAALEEAEMRVLEQQEALDEDLLRLDRRSEEAAQQRLAHAEALREGEARIDARLAEVGTEREAHLPKVRPAALTAYERLRHSARFGGRVAARLEQDLCGACRTSLPITFVTRLRAAETDELVRCQKCQRLLVAG